MSRCGDPTGEVLHRYGKGTNRIMRCPFLKESRAKFCNTAPVKKAIEHTAEGAIDLCTTSAFHECVAFRVQRSNAFSPPCPFLRESRAQVCALDPTVRFVPCSDHVLPRCVSENHRYCQIYLAATHRGTPIVRQREEFMEELPPVYFLAHNHMWLDVSNEHDCHIGLDALLTRILGGVEKLSFITTQGEQCPSVVLISHGRSLHLVFPHPMQIVCCNAQARAEPERVLLDPYGAGWLFEGMESTGTDIRTGLLSGREAKQWMELEVQRVTKLIQRHAANRQAKAICPIADGELPMQDAVGNLRQEEIGPFFEDLFRNEVAT
jgi:glycine cleavage system H lipoate-binding protein